MIDKETELNTVEAIHSKLKGLCEAADTIAENAYGENSENRKEALGQVQSLMYTASGLFAEMENALYALKYGKACSDDPRYRSQPDAVPVNAAH